MTLIMRPSLEAMETRCPRGHMQEKCGRGCNGKSSGSGRKTRRVSVGRAFLQALRHAEMRAMRKDMWAGV